MAKGKITFDDIFQQDLEQRIKSLQGTIADLKKELGGLEVSQKKTNKVVRESVEITGDLSNLQKEEIKHYSIY